MTSTIDQNDTRVSSCTNAEARAIMATPVADRTPREAAKLALWWEVTNDLPADHYE